jgi:arginyl-tRNA synthetase
LVGTFFYPRGCVGIEAKEKNRKEIESVSIAGPGFINFRITSAVFERELLEVISQKDSYGASTIYSGKTVLVEHSSPNLFKPFHIGHMMNNAIGETYDPL